MFNLTFSIFLLYNLHARNERQYSQKVENCKLVLWKEQIRSGFRLVMDPSKIGFGLGTKYHPVRSCNWMNLIFTSGKERE